MNRYLLFFIPLLVVAMITVSGQVLADEIRVAVASNFSSAIKVIAQRFQKNTGHEVILIFGSTGKHYAQIKHGAPFDIFFAADTYRPQLLEEEGIALLGKRFTYALGKLVLWSPEKNYVDAQGHVLKNSDFNYLAMANPKLAPYGKAAKEVLQVRHLWKGLSKRLVRGENVAQTFQFVKSGNAKLGFVAYSQIKHPNQLIEGSFWEIPQALYSPIEQQLVLLNNNNTAQDFVNFARSDEMLKIIADYGYGTP